MLLAGLAWAQEGTAPSMTVPRDVSEDPALHRDAVGFGLGVILGLPTGISGAYHPTEGRVFYDAALAWSFDRGSLHVHGDVLLRLADLRTEEIQDVHFPLYLGIGPRTRFGDSPYTYDEDYVEIGVRVPVGMSFVHEGLPFEAFVELAPGINLFPATTALFDAAIGGRFYFP